MPQAPATYTPEPSTSGAPTGPCGWSYAASYTISDWSDYGVRPRTLAPLLVIWPKAFGTGDPTEENLRSALRRKLEELTAELDAADLGDRVTKAIQFLLSAAAEILHRIDGIHDKWELIVPLDVPDATFLAWCSGRGGEQVSPTMRCPTGAETVERAADRARLRQLFIDAMQLTRCAQVKLAQAQMFHEASAVTSGRSRTIARARRQLQISPEVLGDETLDPGRVDSRGRVQIDPADVGMPDPDDLPDPGLGIGCGSEFSFLLEAPGGRTKDVPCRGITCDKTDISNWAAKSSETHQRISQAWNELMKVENGLQDWQYTEAHRGEANAYEAQYKALPQASVWDVFGSDEAVASHIASIESGACLLEKLTQSFGMAKKKQPGGGGGFTPAQLTGIRWGYWLAGLGAAGAIVYLAWKPEVLTDRDWWPWKHSA